MKRFVFILLIACLAKFSSAQTVFATDSSEWYHHMYLGSFHCYVTGDTVIQGITAKKIKQEAYTIPPNKKIRDLITLYVYTASDTTFYYNTLFHRFTPLYIFNAQEGDTICLPIPPRQTCEMMNYIEDSTFCFVVDSIRNVQYDTAILKTFYTNSIHKANQGWYNRGPSFSYGAYAERVGGVFSGILPYCLNCSFIPEGNCLFPDSLRCYHDTDYSIKLVGNDCDNGGLPNSVATISPTDIKISPNPASDYFRVFTERSASVLVIEIFSTQGQLLRTTNQVGYPISINEWSKGVYFVKIRYKDGASIVKKLVVEK